VPDNGKIILETGPHLTVFSKHFYPLNSSPDLNLEKMKKVTLQLTFEVVLDGVTTPIEITEKYVLETGKSVIRNPLYSDIFLTI